MDAKEILAYPLRGYLTFRSLGYLAELQTISKMVSFLPFVKSPVPNHEPEMAKLVLQDIQELFKEDAENITSGVYPAAVLRPGRLSKHLLRLPKLLVDGVKISRRRYLQENKKFRKEHMQKLAVLPKYYQRNFHFQTDGYLSDDSAKLYDHQVNLLFLGAADSMRRMILPPLKRLLNTRDGQGLRILEVGCGTGSATHFLKMTFPKAKIVATDLSEAYLRSARKSLDEHSGIDFMQAAGESLPFQDGYFDAVVSVFLFHELPLAIRKDVLLEMSRVLKPGGWNVMVDSLQCGDKPQFDPLLQQFPKDFHEPFYKNYIDHPMEDLFLESAFIVGDTQMGFLAKMIAGQKNP